VHVDLHPQSARSHRRAGFHGLGLRGVAWGLAGALSLALVAMTAASSGAAQHATNSRHGAKASSCSTYKGGRNGVIRTFCTGKATAKVTVGGVATVIKGGTCAKSGNYFTVNVGVVVGPGFKGPKPNYFGLDAPPKATTFTNAVLSYAVGGKGGYATSNSGTVAPNHKSGTFSGTDLQGASVSGSFTC